MKEEEINKLKQLDRIEYRQKYNELENNSGEFLLPFMIILVFITFTLLGIGSMILGSYMGSEENIKLGYYIILFAFGSTLFFCPLSLLAMLIILSIKLIKKNKLNKEYFKVEANK